MPSRKTSPRCSEARSTRVRRLTRVAALAAVSLSPALAAGADPTELFEDARTGDVLGALSAECYDAGMLTEAIGDEIIVCTRDLNGDERLDRVPVIRVHEGRARHRIRFTAAERAEGVRVWAYPWIEIEEADGTVLEQAIASDAYLDRVQAVLTATAETLGSPPSPASTPWAARYDSEDEWRLDAHLKAVAYCDETLPELTPEELDRRLEAASFHPFGRDLRSRCEELYEEVFRWGLVQPELETFTVEDYVAYRDAAPPEQRGCTGRLAIDSSCG
jgi:hypothetical protein